MSIITDNFVTTKDSNNGIVYTNKPFVEILPFGSSRESVIEFLEKYSIGKLNNNFPFMFRTDMNGKNGNGEASSMTPQTTESDVYIVPMYNPTMSNNNIQTTITNGTITTNVNFASINANNFVVSYPSGSAMLNWRLLDFNVNDFFAVVNRVPYFNDNNTMSARRCGVTQKFTDLIAEFDDNPTNTPVAVIVDFYHWYSSQWVKTKNIVYACICLNGNSFVNKTVQSESLLYNQYEPNYKGVFIRDLFFTNTKTSSAYYLDKLFPCCSAYKTVGDVAPIYSTSGWYGIYGGYGITPRVPNLLRDITGNAQFKKVFDKTLATSDTTPLYSNTYTDNLFEHMQGRTQHLSSSSRYWFQLLTALYIPFCNRAENLPTHNTIEEKIASEYIAFPKIDNNGSHDFVSGTAISQLPYMKDNPTGEISLGSGHNSQKINTSTVEDVTNKGIPSNVPNLSTIGIFNTSYAISQNELNQFANYVWNTDDTTFDELVENLKMFNNPLDAIIGIRLYPFDVTTARTGVASDDSHIYLGRTETDINARRLYPNWYAKFDMGELTYYGNGDFTDYEPYTKATLKMPFIGSMEIPACYYVDKTIKVEYIVDITTGACTCQIYSNGTLFASMDGVCGIDIPISTVDRQSYAFNKANNKIGTISNLASAVGNLAVGNVGGAISGVVSAGVNEMQGHMIKADISKTSASTPTCSLWTPQTCYLIIEKTKIDVPDNYGKHIGFVLNKSRKLSTLTGFTTCINPELDIDCTDTEREEINNLLNTGVFL